MSSANSFNLDQSKILSSGNGLNNIIIFLQPQLKLQCLGLCCWLSQFNSFLTDKEAFVDSVDQDQTSQNFIPVNN